MVGQDVPADASTSKPPGASLATVRHAPSTLIDSPRTRPPRPHSSVEARAGRRAVALGVRGGCAPDERARLFDQPGEHRAETSMIGLRRRATVGRWYDRAAGRSCLPVRLSRRARRVGHRPPRRMRSELSGHLRGDARFEHCYALDDNAQAAIEQRPALRRAGRTGTSTTPTGRRAIAWNTRWRGIACSRGRWLPTDEAVMQAAPGEGVQGRAVATPAPTSAFAPPPRTIAEANAGQRPPGAFAGPHRARDDRRRSRAHDRSAEARAAALLSCMNDCSADWNKCQSACSGKACDACGKNVRQMRQGLPGPLAGRRVPSPPPASGFALRQHHVLPFAITPRRCRAPCAR